MYYILYLHLFYENRMMRTYCATETKFAQVLSMKAPLYGIS